MLLYIFYNADLIVTPKKEEAMIAYVDNASFYTEGLCQECVLKLFEVEIDRVRCGFECEMRI